VEIKCQLDATDEFLLQILFLAQHVSGTFMPIIRSSRLLHKWLLPVVFGAVKMEIVRSAVVVFSALSVVCYVRLLRDMPHNKRECNKIPILTLQICLVIPASGTEIKGGKKQCDKAKIYVQKPSEQGNLSENTKLL
jgi:hypothetical protein